MFKNKKVISILLTVIMVLTVAIPALAAPVDYGAELTNKPNKTYTQKFTDVPTSHWAFSYIGEMLSLIHIFFGFKSPDKNRSFAFFSVKIWPVPNIFER